MADSPKEKRKPVKLDWQGGLVDSGSSVAGAEAVKLKGFAAQANSPSKTQAQVQKPAPAVPAGRVRFRRETKGRAGKSVIVLFEFGDPQARSAAALRALCSKLQGLLACGGSVDAAAGQIVLQCDDAARVMASLDKCGLTGIQSGG